MDKFTGGGRVGPNPWMGMGGTRPFVTFTIGRDQLVFRILGMEYRIPRSEVVGLTLFKLWSFTGVRIHHARAGYPKCFIFYPVKFSDFVERLGANGYRLVEASSLPVGFADRVEYSKTLTKVAFFFGVLGLIGAAIGIYAALPHQPK